MIGIANHYFTYAAGLPWLRSSTDIHYADPANAMGVAKAVGSQWSLPA